MQKHQICLVILASTVLQASAMIQKVDMPGGLQDYFNGAKLQHNMSDVTGLCAPFPACMHYFSNIVK